MMDIIDNIKFAVDGKVFIGDVDQFVEIGTVAELKQIVAENDRLREALVRLRDCDWVITLPDRMDAVREIARDALTGDKDAN